MPEDPHPWGDQFIADSLHAIRGIPLEVAKLCGRVDTLEEQVDELQGAAKEREASRRALTGTFITVGGVVTAALIGAAATLVVHFT